LPEAGGGGGRLEISPVMNMIRSLIGCSDALDEEAV
jgi:hypothetical protein